jgi:hypothetical protein
MKSRITAMNLSDQRRAEILSAAAECYHANLLRSERIMAYFRGRKLTDETLAEAKLGYAEGGLRDYLLGRGYTLAECQATGLVRVDGKDFFYRKLIIPYFAQGQVVLLRARTDPADPNKAYFPLPGHSIRLYNEDALTESSHVVLTEGEFDCLILKQWGYAAMGLPGASMFRPEWVQRFSHCERVSLCLDTDAAGVAASMDIASRMETRAVIVSLPACKDVSEFAIGGHTREEFEQLLCTARSGLALTIERLPSLPDYERVALAEHVIRQLEGLGPVERAVYQEALRKAMAWSKAMLERVSRALVMQAPQTSAEAPHTLTDEEREEAEALLNDPDLLNKFLDATEQLGCVGDEENKVLLLLGLTSRKLDEPINLVIKSESSAGKSFEVMTVAQFHPPEDLLIFSDVTTKALYYTDRDLQHKGLIMFERQGAEAGDYSIRVLQSEKQLRLLVTMKDPKTGQLRAQEIVKDGPVACIETTTRPSLNPENETRCFMLSVDETEEQTRRIFEASNRRYLGPPVDKAALLRPWQNAQRLLKPARVFISFVEQIQFPTKPLRVRRDWPRFLALIEAVCLLHQYQRERQIFSGAECLVATIEDYGVAYRLANRILWPTLSGVAPKLKELVSAAKQLHEEREASGAAGTFSLKELVERLGWDRKTAAKYVKRALDGGYLEAPDGIKQGKATLYQFVQDAPDAPKLLLSPDELKAKLDALLVTCANTGKAGGG